MKIIKRGFVDLPEGTIHYRSAGTGESLLLIHNATGSSIYFADALPILAQRYHAIAMDLFGHGDSDHPPEKYSSVVDAAAGVVHFLDALDVGRTGIVGLHTGAGIAAEVAIAYPQRVERLVLMGSPDWDEERRVQQRRRAGPAFALSMDGTHMLDAWRQELRLSTPLSSPEMVHRAAMTALQSLWWCWGECIIGSKTST